MLSKNSLFSKSIDDHYLSPITNPIQIFFQLAKDEKLKYDIYRYIIDGSLQTNDCVYTWEERAKGSFKAMLNGFFHVIDTLIHNKSAFFIPTLADLKELHKIATMDASMANHSIPGEVRDVFIYCKNCIKKQNDSLVYKKSDFYDDNDQHANVTLEGFKELLRDAEHYDFIHSSINFLQMTEFQTVKLYIGYHCNNDFMKSFDATDEKKGIESAISSVLKNYEQNISNAKTRKEKLLAIITCVRHLEIIHPFRDGNCRTICVLLLNLLLMSQGFYPVILADSNRFDGYSTEQLMRDIERGINNTISLLNKDKLFKEDFHTSFRNTLNQIPGNLTEGDRKMLAQLTENFFNQLALLASSEIATQCRKRIALF